MLLPEILPKISLPFGLVEKINCYLTVYFFDRLTGDEILVGGQRILSVAAFLERRPLKLKSIGNQSIGIDLTSKKDFMKKYLFFFENELIEVLVISPKSRHQRAKTRSVEEINCYMNTVILKPEVTITKRYV